MHGEVVRPLGEHRRAVTGQVMDLELQRVEHAHEHVQRLHRGVQAFGRIHRDVVVHHILGEERPQDLGVPLTRCSTEVPHNLLGARHLYPPTRSLGSRSGRASHAID